MIAVGLLLPQGFANFNFAPLAVFEAANVILAEPLYRVHVLSVAGGPLRNSFGMTVETERADDVALDTLLVGGAPDNSSPAPELIAFLKRAPSRIRRIAAICGAAFTLGEAGLLDGRRATTHWRLGKKLQDRFPALSLEVDRIFIADGPIWTSAGMTAGIDLALALVEHDLGREKARLVARMMVMHHRRAGGQSQHSVLLEMDAKSDRVQEALAYARGNLGQTLTVEDLAKAACLSPRQFSRVFRKETGLSPAKAIENLRLDAARLMLEQGRLPLGTIAAEAGFGDRERMRRSFQRSCGQNPQAVRNAAQPLAAI